MINIRQIDEPGASVHGLVRQWLQLKERKDLLEDELKLVSGDMDKLADKIKEEFALEGISKVTVDGMTTHIVRDIRISPKDGSYESVSNTLKSLGMDWLVQERYNTVSLKSAIKEMEEAAESGDEAAKFAFDALMGVLNMHQVFNLSARKAAQSKSGQRFLKSNGE